IFVCVMLYKTENGIRNPLLTGVQTYALPIPWHDAQHLKIARLGDNMRNVAVTEGDKVYAQIRLRYSVNGYGVGELVRFIHEVKEDGKSDVEGERGENGRGWRSVTVGKLETV